MRYFDRLDEREQDGFTIVLDKTWEDCNPKDLFDESVTDIKQLCEDIDRGKYDWFILRARVFVDDLELASNTLGGLLYENPNDVLKDGTADEVIYEAVAEARERLTTLAQKFTLLAIKHS